MVRAPEVWAMGYGGQGVVIGGQDLRPRVAAADVRGRQEPLEVRRPDDQRRPDPGGRP